MRINEVFLKSKFNVPRAKMPQIKTTKIAQFIKYINNMGISIVKRENINPNILKTVQNEYSDDGVQFIINKIKKHGNISKPLIISKDYFVMDGHHRLLAAQNLNMLVPILLIDLEYNVLMELMKMFPETQFTDIY